MSSETPAAAPSSAATASGSGPAVRPFCRRPTAGAFPRPVPRRWAEPVSEIERELYGGLVPDMLFLRQRGFGVHCEPDGFRVGIRLVDGDGLRAIATRERRLLGRP